MPEDYTPAPISDSGNESLQGDSLPVRLELMNADEDTAALRHVAEAAFGHGPDADLDEWFSFEEMSKAIKAGRGACMKALDSSGQLQGFTYAQPENPINGREGLDKWVIVLAAVKPEAEGHGIGGQLLAGIEQQASSKGASKMFVYTNAGDERVINFYHENGYQDAGYVRDYQHGEGNSAVFLLKQLGVS